MGEKTVAEIKTKGEIDDIWWEMGDLKGVGDARKGVSNPLYLRLWLTLGVKSCLIKMMFTSNIQK